MPLPTFASAKEIPAGFETEYEEQDGKWVPKELTELKNAHERSKQEARDAKAAAKKLQDQIDEAARTTVAKAAGVTDEQLKKIRDDVAAEKKPTEDALAKAQTELRALRLDGALKKMMLEAGADPLAIEDLYTVVAARFDLNDSGTPILKDKPGTDLKKYIVETLTTEKPRFFLSKQKAGVEFVGSAGAVSHADAEKLLTTNPARLIAMANEKTAA